jgi:hypothetical protein
MNKGTITLVLSLTMCMSLSNINMGMNYAKREVTQITTGYSAENLRISDIVRIWNVHHKEKDFRFILKQGQVKKPLSEENRKTPK